MTPAQNSGHSAAGRESLRLWRAVRDDYLNHPAHGPLPALLIGLTVVTGIVDAVSILALGRVFVANMTGNVVFAIAGHTEPYSVATRAIVAGAAALALGLQNAAVRRLAVPDFTTTVLTMTLTGLAADIRQARIAVVIRRIAAIGSMFAGGLGGAILVLHHQAAAALGAAAALLLTITLVLVLVTRQPSGWHRPEEAPS